MAAVVGKPIGTGVSLANEVGIVGEQDGGLGFAGVHVRVVVGGQARGASRVAPLRAGGVEDHASAAFVGFLHDVAEDVVAAVPVDEDEFRDAGSRERVLDGRGSRGAGWSR